MDTIITKSHWASWENNHGPEQTRFFTQITLEHLPEQFKAILSTQALDFLDWGCAMGDALPLIEKAFPTLNLFGLDISEYALYQALSKYPQFTFFREKLPQLNRQFNILFTSNCLEHFHKPFEVLHQEILPYVEDYLIILVPFKEYKRCHSHFVTFDEFSFPDHLGKFFNLFAKVINTGEYKDTHWKGLQILLLYGHQKSVGIEALRQQMSI